MKLLLIEDEEDLSAIIARGLRKTGYAVDCAYDGEEGLYMYGVNEYDLIILDLNIPVTDGIDVLKQIRTKDNRTKILILSARGQLEERVEGLNLGANDYMVKPFDFPELVARINVLLRIDFIQSPAILICGAVKMDTLKREVFVSHKKVALTKKEYSILEYLLRHKGEVVSAERLIEHVWDSEADLFSNSLKYHLSMLKKKLGVNCIKNIRGQGYIIGG
ncbi:MAG: response regulator transcription factor [Clostridia bacterium]|nr:response regulator transcription factor [Clostridia bacterium]MCI9085173.1 response regulator transcription factor [Clostridia bacterium]